MGIGEIIYAVGAIAIGILGCVYFWMMARRFDRMRERYHEMGEEVRRLQGKAPGQPGDVGDGTQG